MISTLTLSNFIIWYLLSLYHHISLIISIIFLSFHPSIYLSHHYHLSIHPFIFLSILSYHYYYYYHLSHKIWLWFNKSNKDGNIHRIQIDLENFVRGHIDGNPDQGRVLYSGENSWWLDCNFPRWEFMLL